LEPDALSAWFVEHGYRRTEVVELPGEFTRRGGILDVYSPDAEAPYRLEFFGDEIESIRQFDPQSQRSLGAQETAEWLGMAKPTDGHSWASGHLSEYLPKDSWVVLVEPEELREQGRHFLERIADGRGLFSLDGTFQQLLHFPSVHLSALPVVSV